MKVFIEELRVKLNQCAEGTAYTEFAYELNEALNELETRRRASDESKRKDREIARLTEALARTERHIVTLINAGNAMRDELNNRTETTSFKKWFKNLHPETIESVTITLRKKEN